MPFGLKNSPAIFSRVVVATFKEFIHKFLEIYFDDWKMFRLVKKNVSSMCLAKQSLVAELKSSKLDACSDSESELNKGNDKGKHIIDAEPNTIVGTTKI